MQPMSMTELQKAMLRSALLDEPRARALSVSALGLVGETGEIADLIKKYFYHGKSFDRAKLLEECGDVAWYMAYLCHTLEIDFSALKPRTFIAYGLFLANLKTESEKFTRLGIQLTYRAAVIGNYIEDLIFTESDILKAESGISTNLAILFNMLSILTISLNSSFEEICQLNIAKLNKRYPNGFNTADSIARKDEVSSSSTQAN
jgi:NTP pyrophosphatase (non-canonical NTP hydrolase)